MITNRIVLLVMIAVCLAPITVYAQIVDEFKPPAGTCCLPSAAQRLADQLQDWNQLGRYHDDNEKLKQQAFDPRRVVFLGDSITDTWRLTQYFPDKPYVNRGISGQTTPQMLARFSQDVLALHPKAVVILAGINDIFGNTGVESLPVIEDNFRAMVTLAKAAHVSVVLSSVMPALHFRLRPGTDPRAEIVQLNTWLQQFAKEQNLVYLDYYSALVGPDGGMKPELVRDGLHPTNEGYAVMEPLARAAVAKALARPAR